MARSLTPASSRSVSVPASLDPGVIDWDSSEFITAMPAMPLQLARPDRASWEVVLGDKLDVFPFLRHNIRTVTTLYHYRTTPGAGQDCIATACAHHVEASRLFRQSVGPINENNWLPAYMFGVSLTIFYFSMAHSQPGAPASQVCLETLCALRSNAYLVSQIQPYFERSTLNPMVQERLAACKAYLDRPCFDALEALCGTIDAAQQLPGAADQSVVSEAAYLLRQWVHQTDGHPNTWKDILWWPVCISQQFVSLLVSGDQSALVVLVYWCAILSRLPRRWYLDGWAFRTGSAIMHGLSSEWDPVLQWPMQELAKSVSVSRYPSIEQITAL